MLKRPGHKSFRTKLSYRQHARAILQSEVASLVLLSLLFLYSNWWVRETMQDVQLLKGVQAMAIHFVCSP
jgi:hypothetical protein